MTGGSNRDIIQVASGSSCSQSAELHTTKINFNPIERLTGEHDLVILTTGGTLARAGGSPLFVYVVEPVIVWSRFI